MAKPTEYQQWTEIIMGRHYINHYRCEDCGSDVLIKDAVLLPSPDGQIAVCPPCLLARTLSLLA